QFLVNDLALRDEIADYMTSIHDMERLITRISYGSANARELRSLYETVQCLLPIKLLLEGAEPRLMQRIEENIDPLEDIMALIEESIAEDPPFTVREGGMIKEGYSPELDELRDIVANGQGYLATIEAQERERTGIPKLKIGYNKVFGYYLEVPRSFQGDVPEEWIRKQTLTNAERYITGELKELESKVLGAQERITKLEYELFCGVRETVAESLVRIQQTSHAVATLDVLCSFAKVAVDNGYVCPEITEDGSITIKDGRHPVVEKMLDGAPFVPNDTALDLNDAQASIITGPNMAGKSTYMRQVALIVLMAQTGCFVPAASARISICDAIFTRVGASDDLASGQSTFMVEMTEVASILKNATRQSLIILDEIGRGTSTFDGMAIAKSVLEYVCNKRKIGAKTLFATHYHELTDMEEELPGIRNYNIACKKRGDDIIFLRRIVPGPADGSYGIEVAKLAGVPNPVVKRAREVLKEIIEEQERTGGVLKVPTEMPAEADASPSDFQISFTSNASDEILDELKALDVNTFTPIEAMNYLYDLSKRAKES
ncbi:MAG: DNA mismatch repair protein MutS, partial [Clostridia bacterium]|nr:DNA mismatch repair protein MutS [Clostridia bacterium]